jgi:hypothetical protein
MSEHENARDRCSKGRQKQASIFQSKHDGGHHIGIGVYHFVQDGLAFSSLSTA